MVWPGKKASFGGGKAYFRWRGYNGRQNRLEKEAELVAALDASSELLTLAMGFLIGTK